MILKFFIVQKYSRLLFHMKKIVNYMPFNFNHTGKNSIGISVIFSVFKRFFLFLLASCFGSHYISNSKVCVHELASTERRCPAAEYIITLKMWNICECLKWRTM